MLPRCSDQHDGGKVFELIQKLSNDDITWNGNFEGLQPRLSPLAQRVLKQGNEAVPLLRAALTNEHQYVVAHVLLTELMLPESSFDGSLDESQWWGLTVFLFADNHVTYGDHAQADVLKLWNSEPRKQ